MKGNNLKKTLALVILAVLALSSFTVLSLPNVRAQTNQAQVLSYSWYIAPSTTTAAEYIGDLVAVGEVQNTGSTTVGLVWVAGQAYDANGTLLASTEVPAMANSLTPNQKAPFYLDFAPADSFTQDQSWVANATTVAVSVAAINNASDTSTQYTGLTTSNLNGVNEAGTFTVSGAIQNTGDQSVGDVAVTATFYSSNGTVVALSFTDLSSGLAMGQQTSFEVTPWDNTGTLSGEIDSYTILLQSAPVTAVATPEPTAAPTSQPSSSTSSSPNPSQNQGATASILTAIIVVAVLAVIVIIIVALMLIRKRGSSHQNEAPTFPFPPPLHPQP